MLSLYWGSPSIRTEVLPRTAGAEQQHLSLLSTSVTNKLNYPTTAHFLLVWTEILTGNENVGLFHLITLSTSPCWVFLLISPSPTCNHISIWTGIAGKNRFRHSWFALIMGYTFEDIDQQQGK